MIQTLTTTCAVARETFSALHTICKKLQKCCEALAVENQPSISLAEEANVFCAMITGLNKELQIKVGMTISRGDCGKKQNKQQNRNFSACIIN